MIAESKQVPSDQRRLPRNRHSPSAGRPRPAEQSLAVRFANTEPEIRRRKARDRVRRDTARLLVATHTAHARWLEAPSANPQRARTQEQQMRRESQDSRPLARKPEMALPPNHLVSPARAAGQS